MWKLMPLRSSLVLTRDLPTFEAYDPRCVSAATVERWDICGVSDKNRHRLGARKTPVLPRSRRARLDSDDKPSSGGQVTRDSRGHRKNRVNLGNKHHQDNTVKLHNSLDHQERLNSNEDTV